MEINYCSMADKILSAKMDADDRGLYIHNIVLDADEWNKLMREIKVTKQSEPGENVVFLHNVRIELDAA